MHTSSGTWLNDWNRFTRGSVCLAVPTKKHTPPTSVSLSSCSKSRCRFPSKSRGTRITISCATFCRSVMSRIVASTHAVAIRGVPRLAEAAAPCIDRDERFIPRT